MSKYARILLPALLGSLLIANCQPVVSLTPPSQSPSRTSPPPTLTKIPSTVIPVRSTPTKSFTPTQIQGIELQVSESWVRTYETIYPSAALDAVQTAEGNILLVGSTNYSHRNSDDEDIHIMMVDPGGEPLWQKTYGGEKFDRGIRVIASDDGAYLVLAETSSYGTGKRDIYLLKISPRGDLLWTKTFGGPGDEQAKDIQISDDGGFIITGITESYGDGSPDVYLLKIDRQANEEWSYAYGGELVEEGYDVLGTSDGGFLILAASMLPGGDYMMQQSDLYLIKVSASGEMLWSRVYEEPGVQGGHSMQPATGGGYIVAGLVSATANVANVDPLLQKIDPEGHLLWVKPLGESDCFDYASDIQATSDGGYLLTGMSSCNSRRNQILLLKIDQEGEIIWRKYLAVGDSPRIGLEVFEAPNGGLLIVGQVNTGPGTTFETLLIKTDSFGNVGSP
jgi:hypothetical protein